MRVHPPVLNGVKVTQTHTLQYYLFGDFYRNNTPSLTQTIPATPLI